ncbi:AAA3 [Auxenochlorella protothecoides x Auxenochlorella symbiontica]|uniref:ADP,ATP carrier protein n=1 Tax=Auxenochlorella protothecoides TaxID=3075 RepID=A0A1D2A1T2_AUXPR
MASSALTTGPSLLRVRPCALGRRAATVPRCTSGPFSSSKPLRGPGTWLDSRLPQNARSAPWRLCTGPGSAGGRPARPATPAASSQGASNGALPPESGRAPAPARPKLLSLWRKFLPMATLFFLMAFVNTVMDTLKDTLVITAVGGGTQVIPFITVYGVLPASFAFLLAFSWGTQRLARRHLFNITISCFLCFLGGFALFYPVHESLHLGPLAAWLGPRLPLGLAGGVGMLRNWMFTLFYCASELWGDVCLSLLFWGLANETTSMAEAPVLYPLFGIGANIAQTLAGRTMRLAFSGAARARAGYAARLQAMLGLCCGLCLAIMALQSWIAARFRASHAPPPPAGARAVATFEDPAPGDSSSDEEGGAGAGGGSPAAMSLGQAWHFLRQSPQIRCLALLAISQGITSNLLDLAWKHHLHRLATTPAAYSAILGDTAMWTGIVTGSLMLLSPTLFARLGWEGVAKTTPRLMLYAGTPFFLGCIGYNFWLSGTLNGPMALKTLVMLGALLQVLVKGAKFSLFKPAEEMVYIGLDDESRSKGKAAIDVVGAQSGKSASSLLQQTLLLLSGGQLPKTLPIMALFFATMLRQWIGAVTVLAGYVGSEEAAQADAKQPAGSEKGGVAPSPSAQDLGLA